jgi:hypothetical protein
MKSHDKQTVVILHCYLNWAHWNYEKVFAHNIFSMSNTMQGSYAIIEIQEHNHLRGSQ